MTLRIHDNGIDRDMTPAEQTEYEANAAQILAEQQALEAAQAAQAAAKTSARAKLAALGLTDDEIAALVGA
jgi:hypothetical protein